MLLLEQAARRERPPRVQIFATDLDARAIAMAREAIYPEAIAADVSAGRLQRWFHGRDGYFQVRQELRETVLFAVHDVLKDMPFSRLDLITCRNLLIYIDRTAQGRIFDLFHFALRPDGRLMLGPSESVEDASALFGPLDKRQRIYLRRSVARPVPQVQATRRLAPGPEHDSEEDAPRRPSAAAAGRAPAQYPAPTQYPAPGPRLPDLHQDLLLSLFAPPSVLVGPDRRVLHLSGGASRFLRFGEGAPTLDLLQVVTPDLRLDLTTALYAAEAQGGEQRRGPTDALLEDGSRRSVAVTVRPLQEPEEMRGSLLVLFEETSPDPAASAPQAAGEAPPVGLVHQMDQTVAHLQAQLRSTVEQNEASVEELMASNEEQQAVNEELRTVTEELETGREELQSLNEELRTVNQELKNRIDEVSRTNSDLQNLLSSTDVGTLFVGRDLQLMRYTRAAESIFNVIAGDVGRPLAHLTHRLDYDTARLIGDIQNVLRRLIPIEQQVQSADGRSFLMRLLPYRTLDDRIDGVVLTFLDITPIKRMEAALSESEEQLRAFVSATSDIVYEMSADWQEMRFLQGKDFIAATEHPRQDWMEAYIPETDRAAVRAAIRRAIEARSVFEYEHPVVRIDGAIGWTFSRAVPLLDEAGAITRWFGAASDITERRQAEAAVRASEEKYRSLFTTIDEGFCIFDLLYDDDGSAVDWIYTEANPAFEKQTGYADPVGRRISEFQPDLERPWFERFAAVARTGEPVRFVQYAEAMGCWYDVYALRVGAAGDNRVSLLFSDITERKRREANQALLVDVSEELAGLENIGQTMGRLGGRIGRHFGVTRCVFTEISDDSETMANVADWNSDGTASIRGTYRTRDYLSEERVAANLAGETTVVGDTETDPRVSADSHTAIGIRSFITVPLMQNGAWRLLLSITDDKPRAWRDDEIELIRELTTRLWTRLERARAEEALRASEERQAFLLKLSDILRPQSDAVQIQAAVTQVAMDNFGADRCYYCEIEDGRYIIRRDAARGDLPSVAGVYPMDDFPLFQAMMNDGLPFVVRDANDTELMDAELRQLCVRMKIISFINVPVMKDGVFAGNLCVTQTVPRVWAGFEVALAQEIAERTWAAVERARAEDALRRSEEKYRTLFDSMDEGYCLVEVILDENGRPVDVFHLEVNQAHQHKSGLSNIVGQRLLEFMPEVEPEWIDFYGNVALTGQPARLEYYVDAMGRWFTSHASRIGGEGSLLVAIIFDDITERKQNERRQAFLLELSDALRAAQGPMETQQTAMRLLGEHLGVTRAFYFVAEQAEGGDWFHAIESEYRRDPGLVSVIGRHAVREFGGALFEKLDQGEPVEVGDVAAVPGLTEAERQRYRSIDVAAFVNVPLIRGRDFAAGVALHDSAARAWKATEIELVRDVTERTWLAVERVRAEEALREADVRFRMVTDTAPVLIWETDGGGVIFTNQHYLDFFGVDAEAVRGAGWERFLHPDDAADYLAAYRQTFARREPFSYECRFRRADGEYRWLLNAGQPHNEERFVGASADITENKRAGETLRASEARLQAMATNLPGGAAFIVGRDLRYLLAGGEALRAAGLVPSDLIGRTVSEALPPDLAAGYEPHLRLALAGEDFTQEHEAHGTTFLSRGTPLRSVDGDIYAVLVVSYDISQRKRAEAALLESERRFRTLSDAVPQVIWTNDAGGDANYFNQGWYDYTGLTYEQSSGLGWQVVAHPADAPASVARWEQCLASGEVFDTEYRLRRQDGAYRWFLGRNVPLKDPQGRVTGWFGSATDIEEIKQAEEAIRRANGALREANDALAHSNETLEGRVAERTGQVQDLLRQLVGVQEAERARLARELHDQFGQRITGFMLGINALEAGLPGESAAATLARSLREAAAGLSHEVHQLAWSLRPPALDDMGLTAALSTYVREWGERQGIGADFDGGSVDGDRRLPAEVETALYRIAQEALSNVARHAAGASRVSVLLERREGQAQLVIEDDGGGFDPDAAERSERLGLRGMRERMTLLGGTLEVESSPGEGAALFARVPLAGGMQDAQAGGKEDGHV